MSDPFDTANRFMVGGLGDGFIIMRPPTGKLTKAEALNLAAYLVALAEEDAGEFQQVLDAVQGT